MQILTDLLTSLSRGIIIRSLFYLLADLVLASHANVLRGVVFPPFHKLLLTQVQHSFPIVYPHGNVTNQQWGVLFYKFPRIAYFTVPCENEAGVDLLLIQPFLLYYVNHVVLSLTSIFQAKFALQREGSLYQNKSALAASFSLACLEIRSRNEEAINSTRNRIYSLRVFYLLLYRRRGFLLVSELI